MNCPKCGVLQGIPVGIDVARHATAYCPACNWTLIWNGKQWRKGDRDVNWWNRSAARAAVSDKVDAFVQAGEHFQKDCKCVSFDPVECGELRAFEHGGDAFVCTCECHKRIEQWANSNFKR